MSGFRRGVRLGIDVGRARIGVARCDPDGILAVPVETIARSPHSLDRLVSLVDEYQPLEVVVGLPVNLHGADTASTVDARSFAAEMAERVPSPVRLIDERLSTVSAHAALRASGRTQRGSRNIVDQVAAVVLLQQAIDTEKQTGRLPGEPVGGSEEDHG